MGRPTVMMFQRVRVQSMTYRRSVNTNEMQNGLRQGVPESERSEVKDRNAFTTGICVILPKQVIFTLLR